MVGVNEVENLLDGDPVEEAKKALHDETVKLQDLADWCELNFREGKSSISNDDVKHVGQPAQSGVDREIQGSQTLRDTTQFALQALQAVAYNVGILAEGLDNKLANISSDINDMSTDIEWLSLKLDMRQERLARRQIRKLTTQKSMEHHLPSVQKTSNPFGGIAAYTRKPIDLTVLDNIGNAGQKSQRPSLKRRQSSVDTKDSKALPATLTLMRRGAGTMKRSTSAFSVKSSGSRTLQAPVKMPRAPDIHFKEEPSEGSKESDEQSIDDDFAEEDSKQELSRKRSSAVRLSLLPPVPSHFYDNSDDESSDPSHAGDANDDDWDASLPAPPPPPRCDLNSIRVSQNELSELNSLLSQMEELQVEIGKSLEQEQD